MENEIAVQDNNNQPLIPIVENQYSDADFNFVSGTRFLPRLQLFIAKSSAVSEDKIASNHYGLVTFKDSIVDLGSEVTLLVINWRPRALDTSDRQNIRSSFKPESELFQEIKAKSGMSNSGCQYGPEYLIWIPKVDQLATFFLGGATTRNEARMFHTFLTKMVTMKSRMVKTEKYVWQTPVTVPCTIDLSEFKFPTPQRIIEAQTEFLHAPEQSGLERVEARVVDR